MQNFTIRTIKAGDNAAIANIVRSTLAEFGANYAGTVYFDPSTDTLYELFQKEKASYFVAELNATIVGGGGIYPTEGLDSDTCELVKMYLLPEGRGIGLGKTLIEKCISTAKENGFKKVYIETMPELKQAMSIYEKIGFEYLEGPLGNSGHTGCSLWMLKNL